MKKGAVVFLMVLALVFGVFPTGGNVHAAEMIRMSSGTLTGSWYPLMTYIGERILKPEGFDYSNKPGGGVTNIIAVGMGKADMGLAMATGLDMAEKAQGPFKKKIKGVTMLASLFPSVFHLVVTKASGVESVPDLVGKRMGIAKRGQFSEVVFYDVLKVFGISPSQMTMRPGSQSEGKGLMKDRHLDGWNYFPPLPNRHIQEMMIFLPMRLVSLSDDKVQAISKLRKGYLPCTIPKGSYRSQDQDVKTFCSPVGLIVSTKMSNDTAYRLAKALVKRVQVFREHGYSALKTMTLKKMADVGASPLHPGAARLYKEKGLR